MSWGLWVLDTEKVGSKNCVIFPMFSWLYPKPLNEELHVAQSSIVCWWQDSGVVCILEQCLHFTCPMAWNWARGLWQAEKQIYILMFLFYFNYILIFLSFYIYTFLCTCLHSNRPGPSWRTSLDITMCWLISIWANKPYFPCCLNRKYWNKNIYLIAIDSDQHWACNINTSCLFLGYDSSAEIKIPIRVNFYGIYWFFMRPKRMNFLRVSGQPDIDCGRHFVSL